MKPRILLTETNPSLREDWTGTLERARFEVEQAQSARESLYRFCIQTPDLIVLSIDGPPATSLATIDLMRNFNPDCPMVILADDPEPYISILRPGLDKTLKKTIDGPGLLTTIKGLVRPALQQTDSVTEMVEMELPPNRKRRSSGGRHYTKHAPAIPRASLQHC
jgi:DNA-binding response OmpR family regulator